MAKRRNPFVDDYVTQSKVHVGIKQINNNDYGLKKVHEKTLQLLFKGAKKSPAQDVVNNVNITCNTKDRMKQLFIGKDGTLLHAGSLVENIKTKQCICNNLFESQCAYCELVLCGLCQHSCARCERPHCSTCTFIGSEGSEVCVSCYG